MVQIFGIEKLEKKNVKNLCNLKPKKKHYRRSSLESEKFLFPDCGASKWQLFKTAFSPSCAGVAAY